MKRSSMQCTIIGAACRLAPAGLVAIALLGAPLAAQGPTAAQPPMTAFVDVTVVPMDSDRVLPHQTVLVATGRISALGPVADIAVPADARRIDGRGKFLMPGLADMHSHVGDADTNALFAYLANGITTVHLESGADSVLIGGVSEDLGKFRERIARGELVPPRYFARGLFPDCRPGSPFAAASVPDCIAKLKAARLAAREPVPDDTSMHALARRLELGHENHAPDKLADFEDALRFRWKYFDHLLTYQDYVIGRELPFFYDDAVPLDTAAWMRPDFQLDTQRLHAIVETTRRAGTWNIPTLVAKELPQASTLDPATGAEPYPGYVRVLQRRLSFDLQIIKALSDAGAGLLLGADRFDITSGFAVHRELQLLVQAGLTPYQALVTGTRNVAVFTGTADSVGTVAVGKYADLVLLNENPLADVRNAASPAGVMFAGHWLSSEDIAARFDALEAQGCQLGDFRRAAAAHQDLRAVMLGLASMMLASGSTSLDKCQ